MDNPAPAAVAHSRANSAYLSHDIQESSRDTFQPLVVGHVCPSSRRRAARIGDKDVNFAQVGDRVAVPGIQAGRVSHVANIRFGTVANILKGFGKLTRVAAAQADPAAFLGQLLSDSKPDPFRSRRHHRDFSSNPEVHATIISREMPDYDIRLAGLADFDHLHEVARAAWLHGYTHLYDNETINRLFDGELDQVASWDSRRIGRSGAVVAITEGELVAYLSFGPMKERGRLEVRSLYVLPEHQGHGVGKALWRAMEHSASEQGFKEIEVWTLREAGAIPFYLAVGCALSGSGTFTVGAIPREAICLRKRVGSKPDKP